MHRAASTFTYTDWGTVTQLQSNNVAISGTKWYKLQASQTGYFTAEAMFASAGGNVDISLLNSSRQVVLANGAATSAGERADLWVTAGTDSTCASPARMPTSTFASRIWCRTSARRSRSAARPAADCVFV